MSKDQAPQAVTDQEHLRLLSIGYLVAAGYAAFVSLFFLLFAFIGGLIAAAVAFGPSPPGQDPAAQFLVWIFPLFGFGMLLFMMVPAGLQIVAARRLTRRRSRTFCMVIAAITCLSVPFGTLLGIFTFMVLTRPSVARLFDASGPPGEGLGTAAGRL